jgi:UDP-N-acetylmuramyl-tripeptide synthetase
MTITEFAALFPQGTLHSSSDSELTSLAYDSRKVEKGAAFFCFPGTRTEGSLFIGEAIKKGARLIITGKEPENFSKGVSYYITDRSIRPLYAAAAAAFYGYPAKQMIMIGITGTDGKSSTADFTYQLLNALGIKTGLISTVSVDDGTGKQRNHTHQSTPEAGETEKILFAALANGCRAFVLEATSHALSASLDRLASIEFDYSVYTMISSEHLEFHKTYDEYIKAKCALAERTKNKVFVYDTNKEYERIKEAAEKRLVTLTRPEILSQSIDRIDFIKDGQAYFLPFGQAYNLENAYSAASVAAAVTDSPLTEVLPLLSSLRSVPGRFSRIENNRGINIIIDFAHTPKAYESILSECRKLNPQSRFITLFGSSGRRDSSKRPEMGRTAAEFSSVLVITEDDPRGESLEATFRELTSAIPEERLSQIKIIREDDRKKAIMRAIREAERGDFIFLLGIGPQEGIDLGTRTKTWDEEKAVRETLAEIGDGK